MNKGRDPDDLVGLVRVRGHCTFTWRERSRQAQRTVEIRESHCLECVKHVRKLGYALIYLTGDEPT